MTFEQEHSLVPVDEIPEEDAFWSLDIIYAHHIGNTIEPFRPLTVTYDTLTIHLERIQRAQS